ncbi:hypothetical protein [Nitrososphaera sp. AFS]|jgi:hypothetical protein|uniref:hypothetical protein n=1 Tax=Nitrososphaera sp. AFS TaxID=2301191 RepID=UPI00139222C2|nr:hypothetical protein [Nitrososphaera sp. AFS]
MVTSLEIVVTIGNILVTDGNIVVTRDGNRATIDNKLVIGGNREKAIRYSR